MKLHNRSLPAMAVSMLCACAAGGPGRLSPEVVDVLRQPGVVEQVKIWAGVDGEVQKLSVYRQDPGRVPERVRRAALAQFPGAQLRLHEVELYRGEGWAHEVEVDTADGRRCEISVSAAGALRYTECQVREEELPPPVRRALERLLPGGKLVEAERKKAGGREELSVEVQHQGGRHYLRLTPAGDLLHHGRRFVAVLEVPQG